MKRYYLFATILLSSLFAAANADELAVVPPDSNDVSIIDKGRILTQGTPAELIRNNAGSTNLENVFLNLTNRKPRD